MASVPNIEDDHTTAKFQEFLSLDFMDSTEVRRTSRVDSKQKADCYHSGYIFEIGIVQPLGSAPQCPSSMSRGSRLESTILSILLSIFLCEQRSGLRKSTAASFPVSFYMFSWP